MYNVGMKNNFNLKVFSRTSQVGNKYLKFVLSNDKGQSLCIQPVFQKDLGLLLSMADNVDIEEDDDIEDVEGVKA